MKSELDKYIDLFFTVDNPVFYALFVVAVIVLILYIIYFHIFIPNKRLLDKEKLEAELKSSRDMMERFKQLSFQIQTELEEEKQRLARELHDVIGQNLLLLKMELNNNSGINGEVSAVIESTLKDLKEIIFNLRPRALEALGLSPAISNLVEHINNNSDIKGNVNISGKSRKLHQDTELFLYRVVQETINNIIKHSGASEYNINVIYNKNILKIMAMDNGRGMSPELVKNGRGNGLFNIEERIKSLGGKINIASSEGEGTRVMVEIPYEG